MTKLDNMQTFLDKETTRIVLELKCKNKIEDNGKKTGCTPERQAITKQQKA